MRDADAAKPGITRPTRGLVGCIKAKLSDKPCECRTPIPLNCDAGTRSDVMVYVCALAAASTI